MSTFHEILAPTDFSEPSEAAFETACSLAAEHHAKLIVLYVDPPAKTYDEIVDRRAPNGYYVRLREELNALRPADSRIEVRHMLMEGDPVKIILDVARKEHCDLIVMGTHGRSGVGRMVMGSVAEKVLRSAPCPVLTINPLVPAGENPPLYATAKAH